MADALSGRPPADVAERTGTLLLDATYLIRIPSDWNGILLNDLDYAGGNHSQPSRAHLLERGFGLSGTSRLQTKGQPNLDNQLSTLDAAIREFGEPRSIIQIGCSGGGAVALMMAERHFDRIHGSIALCGTTPAMYRHMWTDQLFIAKAILAPDSDLVVVGRNEETGPISDSPDLPPWQRVLEEAQATPLGRARIALVVALTQLPTWGGLSDERTLGAPPDPRDVVAVQTTMAETLGSVISVAIAFANGLWTRYSNADVDFGEWYENADADQRRVVEQLYGELGPDGSALLREDLARLEATPRIVYDEGETDPYWVSGGSGRPGVPLLHVTTMDSTTPPIVVGGYERRVRSEGLQELYRSTYVERANHCGFSIAETAALVDTMVERLDTGRWADTSAAGLNDRAAAYGIDDSRFVDHVPPVHSRVLAP